MSHIPQLVGKTQAFGDWLFSVEQQAQDNASLIAYDRRARIEREVSFDDLLEECVEMTGPQKEAFMEALALGSNADVHTIFCLLDQVKETIVKRRMARGD